MSGEYSAAAFFSAERRGRENGGASMTLEEIARLMMSADYKERFRAEYLFVKRKFEALTAILEKWDAGTLDFTPDCPRSIYGLQISAMSEYLAVLEARAKIEGVSL